MGTINRNYHTLLPQVSTCSFPDKEVLHLPHLEYTDSDADSECSLSEPPSDANEDEMKAWRKLRRRRQKKKQHMKNIEDLPPEQKAEYMMLLKVGGCF